MVIKKHWSCESIFLDKRVCYYVSYTNSNRARRRALGITIVIPLSVERMAMSTIIELKNVSITHERGLKDCESYI